MDTEAYDLYFPQLLNFIYDEEKIVTYKWLSNKLGLHVNIAQEFLANFVKDVRSSENNLQGDLTVIYLLHGRTDKKAFSINLVSEEELENVRNRFKSINVQHVYSVQKQTNKIDYSILYTVDKGIWNQELGGIQYDPEVVKTENNRSRPAVLEKPPQVAPKVAAAEPPPKKSPEKKNNTLTNLFKPQAKKNILQDLDNAEPDVKKPEVKKPEKPKPKGGISNFFSKAPPKAVSETKAPLSHKNISPEIDKSSIKLKETPPKTQVVKKPSPKIVEKKSKQEVAAEKFKSLVDTDDDEEMEVDTKENKVKEVKVKKPRKKAEVKKKTEQVSKKRKRIQSIESSDDDIFARSESESPVNTVEPEDVDIIPSTPTAFVSTKQNKRRKKVEKTYLDDEGFLITKTEFVYESPSEEETEEAKPEVNKTEIKKGEEKKKPPTPTKKVKTSKSPKKQATLMSFFKKS